MSNVAARMYLPFGENLTKDTGGLSSSEEAYTSHFNKSLLKQQIIMSIHSETDTTFTTFIDRVGIRDGIIDRVGIRDH